MSAPTFILNSAAPATKPSPKLVKRPKQVDFSRFMNDRAKELDLLIEDLSAGRVNADGFADALRRITSRAHAGAWALGRQRAGDFAAYDVADALIGRAKADSEGQWLSGFADALAEGWGQDEDGAWLAEKIRRRGLLYIQKARGTANEAFTMASSDTAEFYWKLGGAEKHCTDCPAIALLSPFTKETLFQYPGDGNTPCLGHCKCHLRRDDGMTSFKPVKL